MEALDTCTEEDMESFPQIYLYKDGNIEDIFEGQRTLEEISNFVWKEVDPSRVVEGNSVDEIISGLNLNTGPAPRVRFRMEEVKVEKDTKEKEKKDNMEEEEGEEDEEEEDNEEDCDCSDLECDCSEDEEGNDYEDIDEEEGDEEEDEYEEELSDEDMEDFQKGLKRDMDNIKRMWEEVKSPEDTFTKHEKSQDHDKPNLEVIIGKAHEEL